MTTFAALQKTEEWRELALPAQAHYTHELPYHNWDHALQVAEEVVKLGSRCEGRGLHLNLGLLAVAAAWHDAGFHEDHRGRHLPTKEAYSAYLAENFLRSAGQTEAYAVQVGKAIIGTTHGASRKGINMLALHRADVANIGGLYPRFAVSSSKLLQERRLTQPELSFDKFIENNRLFIGMVIAESIDGELEKLGEPTSGKYSFPVRALVNVTRLAAETEESLLQYAA